MSNLQKLLVKEIAELFGVNRRSISRWVKAEGLPQNPDNTFDAPACVSWLVERIETRTAEGCDKEQPGAAWLEKYREFRAKREEIKLALELAEVIPAEQVTRENMLTIAHIVVGLQNLENRLAPLLVGKSQTEIRAILADEIELLQHCFQRYCRYDSELADEILASLNGETNRQKRLAKLYATLPLNVTKNSTGEAKNAEADKNTAQS